MLYATMVKAHQYNAKKRAQAIGCDKGGLTTKIHTCSDALENLTGFYLTDSAAHDLCGSE